MKKYLLNVKFCAGSDDIADIDTGLYLMESNKTFTKEEIADVFKNTNAILSRSIDDECEFFLSHPYVPYSETGLNLNTLITGVELNTESKITPLEDNCGNINIENYFTVEQWW